MEEQEYRDPPTAPSETHDGYRALRRRALGTPRLQQFAETLDRAIDNHIRWLARVNRALLCHTLPSPDDLHQHPHTRCQFGTWLNALSEELATHLPQLDQIVRVHTQMHQVARRLLLTSSRGELITPADYDALNHLSEQLRLLMQAQRDQFNQDISTLSRQLSQVFENTAEGVIITDASARILEVNDAFSTITGYPLHEVLGATPALLKSGRQSAAFYRALWDRLLHEGQWAGEIWNRRKDGSDYLEWLSIAAVRNDLGETTHYVGIVSDITEARASEQRLEQLAHYDPLTQLPNRTLLRDRTRQAIAGCYRKGGHLGLLFIDLDGFKAINDAYGHAQGDEMLREVALRIRQNLRSCDTLARLGGDEFVVLLTDVEGRQAVEVVAQKLLASLARPHPSAGGLLRLTASIGGSLYPEHGQNLEQLLHQADCAMYLAKRQGKNRYQIVDGALATA